MNNDKQLNSILDLLKLEKAEDAKSLFLKIDAQETVPYLLVKGAIEQKFQNWGEAMNAFNKVLELEPSNAEAVNNLHLIQNILDFWNPEMFNP